MAAEVYQTATRVAVVGRSVVMVAFFPLDHYYILTRKEDCPAGTDVECRTVLMSRARGWPGGLRWTSSSLVPCAERPMVAVVHPRPLFQGGLLLGETAP